MHEHGYSYTVGMRDIGVPELVIYSQRNAEAAEMLSIIYNAAAPMVGEPDINGIVKNVFDPPHELTASPEREKRTLFYAAHTYYDDWFSALKITMTSTKSDHECPLRTLPTSRSG